MQIQLSIFLFLISIWTCPTHALVLEELIQEGILETTLKNKRIGYFIGSFDPLHKGHEVIVQSSLERDLCDYVMMTPVWGGDIYKVRVDVNIRLDMLFTVFKEHPHVIVTRFTPKELQETLTVLDQTKSMHDRRYVKSAFEGSDFIGILGSDSALYLAPNPDTSIVFMTGLEISEEYRTHTWGSCMALPVAAFIVALREGDHLEPLEGHIRERPIITTLINENEQSISSQAVKIALKRGEAIDSMVSYPVIEIIETYQLYRD